MSVCVTESAMSRRILDSLHDEEEKQRQKECGLRLHLAALVREGDMAAPVTVAEPIPVRERGRHVADRFPTLSEVLLDAFDYSKGPRHSEVFEVLCAVAKGEDRQQQAQQLLERAIAEWARWNSDLT